MALFRKETRAGVEHQELAAVPRKLVLRGRITTLDSGSRVFPDGFVCIDNDLISSISAAADGVPVEFQQAPVIDTAGTIYPGLVELHNHPAYNAIPLWNVPIKYPNRSVWRSAALYKRQVANPATLLTHHPQEIYPKSVARFVECRALLGGVTTTQGLTISSLGKTVDYYQGLVRNVEFSYGANWPTATDHINDFASYTDFKQTYGPLMNNTLSRLLIHLCEGTDQVTRDLFSNLIAPDGTPLIGTNLLSIHGTALAPSQFTALKLGGGLIWSPTSNFLLYGATTDITAAIAAGVQAAIGCDWAPSGTKNLLGELKIAKLTSNQLSGLFTDEQLVRMVTTIPAAMIGWDSFLGSVETGKQADLLVIGKADGDPYSALISATESDVAAVLIGGKLRAGRASLIDPTTAGVELIHVANQSMVLDLVDDPTQPLANVTLQGSIATLSYALEHLPDLAKTFASGQAAFDHLPSRFQIRLEMDENLALGVLSGAESIGPGDVDPMELDPITSVDDTTFIQRLKANINLPQWLKNGL
jgi:cytosine/adenosine deaminase-related metal-dependent hydrolase